MNSTSDWSHSNDELDFRFKSKIKYHKSDWSQESQTQCQIEVKYYYLDVRLKSRITNSTSDWSHASLGGHQTEGVSISGQIEVVVVMVGASATGGLVQQWLCLVLQHGRSEVGVVRAVHAQRRQALVVPLVLGAHAWKHKVVYRGRLDISP